MGLHRDGTEYGLKPIETHVRRIIWHQLCILDIRTCEAQGPRPGIRVDEFDTQFPLNVDDIDLDQTTPPMKSAERWTDMTFALMRMECNEMLRVLWFDRPRLEKKQISLTAVLGKIENFKKVIYEKFLPMMDENIPIQQCAKTVMDIMLTRMHIMILHRYHNSVAYRIPDRLRQIILTSGTEQLEASVNLDTNPRFAPWTWYAGAIQQYQTAFLLLAEVFAYPMRKEADRIWRCLDFVFEPPLHLTRDQKARLILVEIRDRMGVYRDARKLRAPTGMLQRIGQQLPTKEDQRSPLEHGPLPAIVAGAGHPEGVTGSEESIMGVRHPVDRPEEMTHPPSMTSGSSVSSGGGAKPVELTLSDELMNDIDWVSEILVYFGGFVLTVLQNEWDRLFPPDINTGELNTPSFT